MKLTKTDPGRLTVALFFAVLLATAAFQGQNMRVLFSDIINRFGMNLVFSLAMIPSILCGTGLNFGITIGILAGILGGLVSIEMGVTGLAGIAVACLVSLPVALVCGRLYGRLLNSVKGSEMVVGTYVGYSAVSLMCIGWLVLPFKSPNMIWSIGGEGLRTTISLEGYYDRALSDLGAFEIFGVKITTGVLVFCALCCIALLLFMNSSFGTAMKCAGENSLYARSIGLDVEKMRIKGTVISTALGAVGIIIYAQAFGFYQLYNAPLNMSSAPVAAVLIGGASTGKIKISHAVIGTLLYQGIITVSSPVIAYIAPDGGLSDVVRMIVSNGIILYALTRSSGRSAAGKAA